MPRHRATWCEICALATTLVGVGVAMWLALR